jgi:hypothetical protein
MMKAILSSETSVFAGAAWRNIQEDGILPSHRRENLKFYILTKISLDGEIIEPIPSKDENNEFGRRHNTV